MTFGSLFAGIGGIDLGLERAGMECRWQVEIDPFCNKVLAKHWPGVKRYGDITRLTGHELEPVDLLCGGFPCQDLSQAGKRAGIEGSRSGLWFEFARIIGVLRPRYVLIENVPGVLDNHAMRRVVGELARLGYVGFWRCLRAADFRASHLRKRVFILAYRTDNRHVFGPGSNSIRENVLSTQSGIRAGQQDRTGEPERRGGNVAYRDSRRFGELRQPSGTERFPNRHDTNLADSEHAGFGILGPTHDANRNHASGHDADGCGAGILDNSAEPQCRREFEPGRTGKRRPGSERADGTLADAEFAGLEIGNRKREQQLRQNSESLAAGLLPGVADAGNRFLPQPRSGSEGRNGPGSAGKNLPDMADTERLGHLRNEGRGRETEHGIEHSCFPVFAPGPNDPRWPTILAARPDLAPALGYGKKRTGNAQHSERQEIRNESGICGTGTERSDSALESAVRGVADGIPNWAHGGGVNDDKVGTTESGAEGLPGSRKMRGMRRNETATTPPSEPQQINGRNDSVPDVPRSGTYEHDGLGQGEEAAEDVPGLRDRLHAEPFQESQHMQPGMSLRDWQKERDETLALAMSNRTKRLGRLGNAVVPQVAEWIGRRILEIENGTY